MINLSGSFVVVALVLLWATRAVAGPIEEGYTSNDPADPGAWHLSSAKTYPLKLDAPFTPDAASLEKYQVPEWYRDAKFGIFLHWGLFSVPAYGTEWYANFMYLPHDEVPKALRDLQYGTIFDHHLKTYGKQSDFGYKDFAAMFKPQKYDPNEWADLFKATGARYVVPVAEFHDGFPMYASTHTHWNVVEMGPKRDVYVELEKAVRKQGMKFGVSSHRAFDWRFYTFKPQYDTTDPANIGIYGPVRDPNAPPSKAFIDDEFGRSIELIELFHPDLLWFDAGIEQHGYEQYRLQLATHFYNRATTTNPDGVVLNYKGHAYPKSAAVVDLEASRMDGIRDYVWQTDDSTHGNWGYKTKNSYRDAKTLLHELIDIVSKNGNLLLNVGPQPDGQIPQVMQDTFREMGQWLSVNGEAIYATRPFQVYGEGNDLPGANHTDSPVSIRYTMSKDHQTLYPIAFNWPAVRELTLYRVNVATAGPDAKIVLLGSDANVPFKLVDGHPVLTLPTARPEIGYAYAFKLTGFKFAPQKP